jgi:hypothetical protein
MYGSNVTYILNYSSSGDMDDTLMIRQDSSATILVYVIVFGEKKKDEKVAFFPTHFPYRRIHGNREIDTM